MKKLILFILTFFVFITPAFAGKILVEDVFSDISSNYKYRDELQILYDRGMILPNESGKFSPNAYLNRDEFVGISMEVICERCIQPHTKYEFIDEYSGKDIYFDIDNSNPYFYCVAEADKNNYVRGYDIGESCQNGTNKFDERPFCPLNRINLEEAVAVLLRNSSIFTINDNNAVIRGIREGRITQKIANDVSPTDYLGNPYTFYGYIEKALDYKITEYDISGNQKIYNLLETDALGNVNPNEAVTKEQFLRMSYIALKSNSCGDIEDNDFGMVIHIWEKTCELGDTNCTRSNLNDPEDTYDFTPEVEGFCEAGINDPNGYRWRFYNTDNGDEFFHYGTYIDDITLPSVGEWRVFLSVRDKCGNTGSIYSTIFVEPKEVEQEIDVDIDVFDDDCTGSNAGCVEIEFENQEDDGDNIFDFDGDVSTSCSVGSIDYNWTFRRVGGSERFTFNTEFVDNFDFLTAGEWHIFLDVQDGCGQTGSEEMTYIVHSGIQVDINVYDDACTGSNVGCVEIDLEDGGNNSEDDGDNIFDFDGDISTSCKVGSIDYNWTFRRVGGSENFNFSGEFVDNFDFLAVGEWRILLDVQDGCNQTASSEMTYIVYPDGEGGFGEEIDVDINIYDDICTGSDAGCEEVGFVDDENDGDDIFDFDGDVTTSCEVGDISYNWTFSLEGGSERFTFTGEFVDNFHFLGVGKWNILLEAQDGCGQTGSKELIYIVHPEGDTDITQDIDVDIDVFDDDCTGSNAGCIEIEFEDEEDDGDDIFDFDGDVTTSCEVGDISYSWTFRRVGGSERFTFNTEFVDNFDFLVAGEWHIRLEVRDGCGQTGSEQMTYIVYPEPDEALSVSIIADPFYGYNPLLVDFEGVVDGGEGPYTYSWSFGDVNTGIGKEVEHIYLSDGVFEVHLVVVDVNGVRGDAKVLINVYEDTQQCLQDTDGDGFVDCDDLCPTVAGTDYNEGCPEYEISCDVTCGCPNGYSCSDKDPLTCGSGVCRPIEIDSSCLYNPSTGSIFGNTVCTSCPCNTTVDFLADIRKCDLVFPAITSPDASSVYSKGSTWEIK